MRLDQFLSLKGDIKSRAQAQKLIEDGLVKVNGIKIKKASMDVGTTHRIEYTFPPLPPIPDDFGVTTPLPVLFENDECMVINKPAHIAVHPGNGMKKPEETILSALKPLFAKRKLPYSAGEVLVHRLDKDTTGCLLIAKTPKAHAALQKQFADRTIEKMYLTIVSGRPNIPTAMIDAPIGRHGSERTKMSIHQAVNSRSAKTTYRTIASAKGASLLECDLHTGRTHQIRVHLASIGHPVLGDETYDSNASHDAGFALHIESLCLHAWRVTFKSEGKNVTVTAPLPETFSAVLQELGVEWKDESVTPKKPKKK